MSDLISRQAAIDAIEREKSLVERPITETRWFDLGLGKAQDVLSELPSAQPEITDEQAIGHLQTSGWMQNHDREMYESGLNARLADDSGDYESLIPCADAISRQTAIDAIQAHKHNVLDAREYDEGVACGYAAAHNHICDVIAILPSAQPELRRGEGS